MQRLHATAHATISNAAMYTLGTAAKSVGRNKSTILRAIKNGVISATKGPQGDYQIDPAELHRIYPPVASGGKAQPDTHTDAPHEGTLDATPLLSENRELRAKLEAAEERLKDRAEVIGGVSPNRRNFRQPFFSWCPDWGVKTRALKVTRISY